MKNLIEFIKKMLRLKNPCKKCLVTPACTQHDSCPEYREYKRQKHYIDDKILDTSAITIVIIGCLASLFLIFIGILGFIKFFEII